MRSRLRARRRNADAPWVVVTGLDGSGKTTLVAGLAKHLRAHSFRLPFHEFVLPLLSKSGGGSAHGDVHTDRLVFALDARLANYSIREWRKSKKVLVSQRGWMDNFIFGAAQGLSYREIDAMLRTAELERASAHIFLTAAPEVAFERIRGSAHRDKYETREFLAVQFKETLRFLKTAQRETPVLQAFAGIPAIHLDTTTASPEETFAKSLRFLEGLKIC